MRVSLQVRVACMRVQSEASAVAERLARQHQEQREEEEARRRAAEVREAQLAEATALVVAEETEVRAD